MPDVRRQFEAWRTAFRASVKSAASRLTIRFCLADVLSFTHSLVNKQANPSAVASRFVRPWSMRALELDGDVGSTDFGIIETANLVDQLGLLNILVAAGPLLRPCAAPVMYTEARMPFGEDASATLREHLCGDVRTMATLLGLAPRSVLVGLTSRSDVHEVLFEQDNDGILHERFAWIRPSGASAPLGLILDAPTLGGLFFDIYEAMLAEEHVMDTVRSAVAGKRFLDQGRHTRASLACRLYMIHSRLAVDDAVWDTAMTAFHDTLASAHERVVGE